LHESNGDGYNGEQNGVRTENTVIAALIAIQIRKKAIMNEKQRTTGFILGSAILFAVVTFTAWRIANTPDKLRVGYMQISAHAPVIAAKDLGIFAKHGLEVDLIVYPDTASLMTALEKYKVDIGYQLTADVVLNAAAEGKEFYVYFVAQSTESAPMDGFYAIGDVNAEMLRNKKIGCFPGPTGMAMTKALMKTVYGLGEKEYTLEPIPPPLQISSLRDGRIAALFTYEPLGTLAVNRIKGAKCVVRAPVEKYVLKGTWNGGIGIFTSDLVTRRRATARAFQLAIRESCKYIEDHPGIRGKVMASLQPGLEPDIAQSIPLVNARFASTQTEATEMKEALESQIEIYRGLGIVREQGRGNLQVFNDGK
jgi:ABC-type nitrate/sulfonate/bicarbonate transport system substrate-binding protein